MTDSPFKVYGGPDGTRKRTPRSMSPCALLNQQLTPSRPTENNRNRRSLPKILPSVPRAI